MHRVLAVLLAILGVASGSSLMKRIREQQSADESKGLDMGGEGWLQVPQPIQDVLMSIDDKLRGLDTFSYTLKLARLDFSLDQLVRRMENIETKLGRLETKFDVRMEKVEEVVISKDIKEEFSNEHLSRRMEALNDKINSKVAYLDSKIDIRMERVANKLELLQRDLHSSSDDLLERLVKSDERREAAEGEMAKRVDGLVKDVAAIGDSVGEGLASRAGGRFDELGSKLDAVRTDRESETEPVRTRNRMMSMLQDSNDKIDALSATFTSDLYRSRSSSGACDRTVGQERLDNLTTILEKALTLGEARLRELDSDVEQYARKVINGIQELWRSSDELKADLSSTLEQGSKTRELVRQEFQRLHRQIEPLPKLEPQLTGIGEDLDQRVVELSATVDNSFATLLVAQNTFIDSCRRIQQEETHVFDILQSIVHEMRNRSIADIYRIATELRNQSTQINRSLAHVLTAVLLTGNITTSAVNDLVLQLKQKDHCVILTADNIKWNAMESICSQLAEDELGPLYKRNGPGGPAKPDSMRAEGRTGYDGESENEESIANINDYEMDYKISDAEYKDDS